jgi:hypothetical protein
VSFATTTLFQKIPLLLSESGRRAEQIGRQFQSEGEPLHPELFQELIHVLAAIAAAVALGLISWLIYHAIKVRREREYHSPRKLFLELAQAHELSLADRQLMRDISAWHRLENATLLFVDPQRFRVPAMIAAVGRESQIAALDQRLFGTGPEGAERATI